MKFEILKCPNCNGKIRLDNEERATCTHCGYEFVVDDENVEIHNHYYNNSHANHTTVSKTTKPQAGTTKATGFLVFIVGMVVFMIITANIISPNSSVKMIEESFRTIPFSEPMIKIAENIYNKSVYLITDDEFASLKYLDISSGESSVINEWFISYSFEKHEESEKFNESIKTSTVISEKYIEKEDFQCFTGLMHLGLNGAHSVSNEDYKGVSLASLKELVSYSGSFNEGANELSGNLYDNKKITKLAIQLRNMGDLDTILAFTNLQSLDITYLASGANYGEDIEDLEQLSSLKHLTKLKLHSVSDISWLSSLTTLENLVIGSGYQLNDYKVLYGMPKLNTLEVYSADNLKDLGFVKSMPELKRLVIESSPILTLKHLEDKTSLMELVLYRNTDLNNTEAVATLTSLRILEIDTKIPRLDRLEQLTSLKIDEHSLDKIINKQTVEELSLEIEFIQTEPFDCSSLLGFTKLKTLEMIDGDISDFTPLIELSELKSLTLREINVPRKKADITVFQHPTLERLVLVDSELIVNPSLINDNNMLKSLEIIDCNYWTKIQNDEETRGLTPAAFPELFASLKAIESLSLPSAKLETLDFARDMQQLKRLDITDNFIADLLPISKLENLEYLFCAKNPINNYDILPDDVKVVNESF